MSLSKSRSLKSNNARSFTINNAYHIDGCKTKFSHKDYTGRFTGHSSQRASMKALTKLCSVKNIKGQCSLYIEMRETTQGSNHKLYAYKCNRIKKDKPLIIPGQAPRHYDMICKPVRIPKEKCKKSRKTSGRMRSIRVVSQHRKSKLTKKNKSKSLSTKKSLAKSMINSLF